MKKLLVYLVISFLLGVLFAIVPLGFVYPSSDILGGDTPLRLAQIREQTAEFTPFEENLTVMGLPPFPSSLIYVGLLFLLSLTVALGCYVFSKRFITFERRVGSLFTRKSS